FGVDEEQAIADYLPALRESQIQQQTILPNLRSPAGNAAKVIAPQPVIPSPRTAELQVADLHTDLRKKDLPGRASRDKEIDAGKQIDLNKDIKTLDSSNDLGSNTLSPDELRQPISRESFSVSSE